MSNDYTTKQKAFLANARMTLFRDGLRSVLGLRVFAGEATGEDTATALDEVITATVFELLCACESSGVSENGLAIRIAKAAKLMAPEVFKVRDREKKDG